MIELVFVVCMVASPAECRQERPAFQPPYASPASCLLDGQLRAVEWQGSHPGWSVRRWSCALPQT
ncbi:hypothetical protein [Azospirillum sp. ST 5-10]|uniref:hypothetical protein n=1 Tax=unclassified Azospirillum TaxID=2630922 RepID=UPI003F4A1F73